MDAVGGAPPCSRVLVRPPLPTLPDVFSEILLVHELKKFEQIGVCIVELGPPHAAGDRRSPLPSPVANPAAAAAASSSGSPPDLEDGDGGVPLLRGRGSLWKGPTQDRIGVQCAAYCRCAVFYLRHTIRRSGFEGGELEVGCLSQVSVPRCAERSRDV